MSIRNILLVLLFGGLVGATLLREQQRGTMEPLDRAHREFLKANPDPAQMHQPLAQPSVILARMDDIDQPNRVFSDWPLTAADWLIVLQNLPGYAPKTAAISAPLPPGTPAPAIQDAVKNLPGLLVSVQTSTIAGDGVKELPASLPALTVGGRVDAIPSFASITLPAIPGTPGVERIDFAPKEQRVSIDGDSCRVPMLARMGDKVVPSLALRALMEWAQVSPADLKVQTGEAITSGTRLRIPIDEAGFFRFYLSLAPQVPAVNADEFVLSKPAPGTPLPAGMPAVSAAEQVSGSVLWFGHDDKATRSLKLPNGTPVSPAELTARALAAIQTGAFMRPLEYRLQWIPPAATLLVCLWLAHWRKSWLWLGVLLATAALGAASLYLYRQRQEWMPLGPSLGIIAASALLAFILPPPPRRGKPAIIPGTRTAASRRTRTRPPQTSTLQPKAETQAQPESGTPDKTTEPPAPEPAPPAESTASLPEEPAPPAEEPPISPPAEPSPAAEPVPAEEQPEPTDESLPAQESMHHKRGKKKRRR